MARSQSDLFADLDAAMNDKAARRKSGDASDNYTAADIEVLEGLEPVRRRPGMYIGAPTRRRCTTSSPK